MADGNVFDLLPSIFTPTRRQIAMRDLAVQMTTAGKYFRREWLRATSEDPRFNGTAVKVSEWRKWEENPGFGLWFYAEFHETLAPNEAEMAMMEADFWDALRQGLQEGDASSLALFQKIRFAEKSGQVGATSEGIKSFLQSAGGSGWIQPEA